MILKKLEEVETTTLIEDLANLSDAIKKCIFNLEDYASEELEDFKVTEEKFSSEAYSVVNEIVWLKSVYENAEKRYKNAIAIGDENEAQASLADMYWAGDEAQKYYAKLIELGHANIADELSKKNYENANKLREELLLSFEKYEAQKTEETSTDLKASSQPTTPISEEQKAVELELIRKLNLISEEKRKYEQGDTEAKKQAKETGKALREQIKKLDLDENIKKQVIDVIDHLNAEQSKQFVSELSLNESSRLRIIEKWSTQTEGVNRIALNAANQFVVGNEVFTASVDLQSNTATIMSASGEEFKIATDDFGNIVGAIPNTFKEVASQLQSAITSAVKEARATNPVQSTNNSSSSRGGGSSGGGGGSSSVGGGGSTGGNNSAPTVTNSNVNGVQTQTVTDSKGNSHTYVYQNGQWMSNNGTVPEKSASGTLSAEEGLYNIDEIGKEIVIPSGRLRMMEYGDQVIPHNISENLLKWGTLNPALLRGLSPELTNNITNNKTTEVKIENVNLENVTNGNNFMPELNRYLQRTNTLA